MNSKQLKYSRKKVRKAIMQTQLRFFLFLMLIVAIPATVVAFTETDHSTEAVSVFGGATMASMLAIGNIEDVGDNEVSGEALAYKIWLIHYKQIDDTKPFPKPNASREVGAVPLKPGEKPIYMEAHDIPTVVSSGEKGDLTVTGTNTLSIIMGGVRDQLLNFIEQYAGSKFIIFFKECGSDTVYMIGTACKPMVLKSYNKKNDKESRSVTFTFENKTIQQYKKYTGDLSGTEPALHAADTTVLTIQPGVSTYRIPDGSAATYAIATLTGLSANDEGRYITLLGEGTTKSATIAESAGFILKNGATWTAKSGSQIVFYVLDSSTLVEVSRVQTV